MSIKKSIAISVLSLIFSIISTRLVFCKVPNFYSFYLSPVVTIIVIGIVISYHLEFSMLLGAIYNLCNKIKIKSSKYWIGAETLAILSLTTVFCGMIYENAYFFIISLVAFLASSTLITTASDYERLGK